MLIGGIFMEMYRRTLVLLLKLMNNIGSTYWANHIKEDIQEWDNYQNVDNHLSAYHKDGLSDLWICEQNGHTIKLEDEVWANVILDNICYIAVHIGRTLKDRNHANTNIDEIIENKVPFIKQNSFQKALIATICRKCNYLDFSSKRVEWSVASIQAQDIVREHFNSNIEDRLIDFQYIKNIDKVVTFRDGVVNEIKQMNYNYSESGDFMRLCYRCGNEDTAIKYFNIEVNHGRIIIKQI
jgi:hypothetical protein